MNTFEKMQANIKKAMTHNFAEGTEFRISHYEDDRRVSVTFSTFAEAYASGLNDSKYASEIRGCKIEIKRPENKVFQKLSEIKL